MDNLEMLINIYNNYLNDAHVGAFPSMRNSCKMEETCKWGCNCITWVFGVGWKQQWGLGFRWILFLVHSSFFFLQDWWSCWSKFDIFNLLFLVVKSIWRDVWNKVVTLWPKLEELHINFKVFLGGFFLVMLICIWVCLFSWIW